MRSFNLRPVCPTYDLWHWSHWIMYTTDVQLHVNLVVKSKEKWGVAILLLELIKWHNEHCFSRHFFSPCSTARLVLSVASMGTFALHSVRFKLLGCLKATIGGFGKISAKFGSVCSVFQCFKIIFEIDGRAGEYVRTKVTLSGWVFSTFFRASILLTFDASWIFYYSCTVSSQK